MGTATDTNGERNGVGGLWTVHDVASFLRMSTSWVYKRVAEDAIPCVRLGASVRFKREDIAAYASGRMATQASNVATLKAQHGARRK